jgi:hypothetical protein
VERRGYDARFGATARSGALTLIQRFGSALNLNLHFHMLFLDGVYTERADGAVVLRWVKAPRSGELTDLAQRIAQGIGRLLERDAENTYLAGEAVDADPMESLLAPSIT